MAKAQVVDFSGVKDRGSFNTKRVPAGDYAAKIVKVEDGESSKDSTFQYVFTIKLRRFSQMSYPYYCKLQENQLWKLRNLAVAAGLNVPKKRMKFDPNKVVGKEVGVTMEDDEYEGKPKSVIAAVFPVSELADGGEEIDSDEDQFEDGTDADEDEDVATAVVDSGDDEDEADDEPEEKPKKKKKDKGDAEGGKKKKKKKKSDDEDLEELDISDV